MRQEHNVMIVLLSVVLRQVKLLSSHTGDRVKLTGFSLFIIAKIDVGIIRLKFHDKLPMSVRF